MALDALVDSAQLNSDLKDVADAIRAKSGGTGSLTFPSGFVSEIEGIKKIEIGTITVSSDNRNFTINHSLNVKPKIVFFTHNDIDTLPSSTVFMSAVGAYLGDYDIYVTSANYKSIGVYEAMTTQTAEGRLTRVTGTSASYGFTTWTNESVVCTTTSTSSYWKQGTYTYYIYG